MVIGGYMLGLFFDLKMQDLSSSGTSVNFYQATCHHIPDDSNFMVTAMRNSNPT
jgi:hypothetical protein